MTGGRMTDHWDGDLLGRRQAAEFFYKFLLQQSESRSATESDDALCVAVDADWGAGKTYFLDRLAKDIEANGHAVIQFNAWINDLDDDPLVGFMAAVKEGLAPLLASLPLVDRPRLGEEAFLRKASKALFKGALAVVAHQAKKTMGAAGVEAVASLFSGDSANVDLPSTIDPGALEAGAEKLFKSLLENHSDRVQAVTAFKTYLGEAVLAFEAASLSKAPLFIIIDELDRCRPDYAIRLLEGVKHVFGAQNVCFVVGVNLEQTSESVRAVYGAGFDGRHYLKRFFAVEYHLPSPAPKAYCQSLAERSPLAKLALECGLPTYMVGSPTGKDAVSEALLAVAEAFSLKPRSIAQILTMSEAACVDVKKETVHLLYLFFLAALLHRSPKGFEFFEQPNQLDGLALRPTLESAGFKSKRIDVQRPPQQVSTTLIDVILLYREVAKSTREDLIAWLRRIEGPIGYPALLKDRLCSEVEYAHNQSRASVAEYGERLRQAGYLFTSGAVADK